MALENSFLEMVPEPSSSHVLKTSMMRVMLDAIAAEICPREQRKGSRDGPRSVRVGREGSRDGPRSVHVGREGSRDGTPSPPISVH
eukprot:6274651-Prymnesium_polylepis.1